MFATKALRWLTTAGAVVIAMTVAIHAVRAQEDDIGDAAKVKKTVVHASGSVVIAPTACPSPAAVTVQCYSITAAALKQGSGKTATTGTLTGTLLVSTPGVTKKDTVCYSVINTSTETLTLGTTTPAIADITFGAPDACIKTTTKKKVTTSSEYVSPPGVWTSATGSPVSGKGKETWKVTPTDATSTTSPLAGDGTISFTGSETP